MFFLKTFGLRVLFCLRYLRLFLAVVIGVFLLPILFFCPASVSENFGDKVDSFLLKTLWFIWRLIRALLLFTLVLVLFVLSPILWPIYLGIAFFWPGFVINLFSIKLF